MRSAHKALGDNYRAIGDDVFSADSDAAKYVTSKKYNKALSKYRTYTLTKC